MYTAAKEDFSKAEHLLKIAVNPFLQCNNKDGKQ